ncbi:hypothetical protein B0H11DRAFT_2037294 [Mycena galericulata]|nr:hypothetical protein B0H11DRAFT_2037294 [Mycena galericulata]
MACMGACHGAHPSSPSFFVCFLLLSFRASQPPLFVSFSTSFISLAKKRNNHGFRQHSFERSMCAPIRDGAHTEHARRNRR